MSLTLAELAKALGARLQGAGSARIGSIAPLVSADSAALTFMLGRSHLKDLRKTRAGAVILRAEWAHECPVAALIVENPHAAFARAAALLYPSPPVVPGIHPTAVVSPGAEVAEDASVGAHAVIEEGCRIGSGAHIGPGCVLMARASIGAHTRLVAQVFVGANCHLGEYCLIHPGVVIGADGFGLANEDGRWIRVPQIGRVIIGEGVDIGANTTVDRGAIEDTVIEDGVKLDNQIQVAHNVRIGEHTAIAGCVGIAGSADIGRGCTIGGGVGIAGHLHIADGVHVTGMSLVAGNLEKQGAYSSSLPAQPLRQWQKNAARLRHLDELAHAIKRLEAEVGLLRAPDEQTDNSDQA